MSLTFQKIPIVFGSGIDTETDRKMVLPSKLLTLQNGVFRNANSISKRFGHDHLSLHIDGADSILSGAALSTFKDELLLFDGSYVYSRLDASDTWSNRGAAISVSQSVTSVARNGYQQLNPDLAVNSGLAVYAWEDSRGPNQIRYSVTDISTGAFIIADQLVTENGSKPKVLALANYTYIFFTDGGSIKIRSINKGAPSTLSAELSLTVNLNVSTPVYDVCVNGNRIYFSFNNATAGTSCNYFDTNLAFGTEVSTSGAAETICSWVDNSSNIFIAYHDGYAVNAYALEYTLNSLLGTTLIETIDSIDTIAGISSSANIQTLFYDVSATNSIDKYIKQATLTTSGTLGTPSVFKRSVGLASKPFLYNESMFIHVAYSSPYQSTYFTLSSNGNVISKIAPTEAGGHRTNRLLPQVAYVNDSHVIFAASKKNGLYSEGGIFTLLGVIGASTQFVYPNNFYTSELGGNLFIIGGIVQSYDGVSLVEHNYNLYPDSSFVVITPNGGAPVADTTPPTVTITGAS